MSCRTVTRFRRAVGIGLLVVATVGAAACGSGTKSPAQQASSDLNKGLAEHVAGKLDAALVSYRKVLVNDPSNKFALYDIALIEQNRNQLADADRDYGRALESDPKYVPALFNLATVRTALKDDKGAVELYQQVVSLQPDYAAAHLNLGVALQKVGQEAQGQAEIAKAQQLGLHNTGAPAGG